MLMLLRHCNMGASGVEAHRTMSIDRWMRARAEIILLPREGGGQQRPPRLFTGYRCSTFRLDRPHQEWPAGYSGFAIITLLERDEVPVGESAKVAIDIRLFDRLVEDLRAGARFSLYAGGRRVVAGTVITLLEDVDSE